MKKFYGYALVFLFALINCTVPNDTCNTGYWGSDCGSVCNTNFWDSCDHDNGFCDNCRNGIYWGAFCDNDCPESCPSSCDRSSGYCDIVCTDGKEDMASQGIDVVQIIVSVAISIGMVALVACLIFIAYRYSKWLEKRTKRKIQDGPHVEMAERSRAVTETAEHPYSD